MDISGTQELSCPAPPSTPTEVVELPNNPVYLDTLSCAQYQTLFEKLVGIAGLELLELGYDLTAQRCLYGSNNIPHFKLEIEYEKIQIKE